MSAPALTLPALLGAHIRERGDQPALIYQERAVSYAAIDEESRRVARGLRELGVTAGDRVSIWMPNTPAWLAALLACARLGAIALATNTRYRSAEMGNILERSAAKVLLLWPGFRDIDFLSILEDVPASSLPSLAAIVAYDEGGATSAPTRFRDIPLRTYRDVASNEPLDDDASAPDAGCVIFTTSGTTSAPKFVLHTQRSICVHAAEVAPAFRYTEPDTIGLGVIPFCGVYGFVTMTAMMVAGVPLVTTASFNAAETISMIERHRVTSLNLTGDMVRQMLATAPRREAFASVRFCGCGNGSPQLAPPAEENGLILTGIYGSSEVQALFSRQDETIALPERSVGGGLPVSAQARVRARDLQSGAVLPHGEHGMLEIRAPSMLQEYFGDEAATRAAMTEDGYFKTGDLGYTQDDGRFVFLARIGDALRLSGFLVSPAEIEEIAAAHPSIAACQVIGTEIGQGLRAVAFVILRPGATLDEASVIEHCRARIARYKVPARVFAVDEFPTTVGPNGVKVRKEALRELARELCAS